MSRGAFDYFYISYWHSTGAFGGFVFAQPQPYVNGKVVEDPEGFDVAAAYLMLEADVGPGGVILHWIRITYTRYREFHEYLAHLKNAETKPSRALHIVRLPEEPTTNEPA